MALYFCQVQNHSYKNKFKLHVKKKTTIIAEKGFTRDLTFKKKLGSYRAVLSCGAVYYAVQGGSNFKSLNKTQKCDHSNESY